MTKTEQWGPLKPGSSFGRYVIHDELGRGRQGTVYLASRADLPRRVALKLLHTSIATDPLVRARFEREVSIAARLDHPSLCAVYESGVVDGVPFVALEHIEGMTLARKIEQRRSELQQMQAVPSGAVGPLLELIEKLARGLDAVHEQGLVHGDVKPSNVMVTPWGEPVLLDLVGAWEPPASGLQDESGAASRPGTLPYLAPEQVDPSLGSIGPWTDIHALGVTLYESLTLRLPYSEATPQATCRAILESRPPHLKEQLSGVPRDLETVLATALAKDIRHRYQTAGALAEDLRRVRRREPILVQRPSLIHRLRLGVERDRPLATALAAVILVVVIGLGVSLALLSKTRSGLAENRRLTNSRLLPYLLQRAERLLPGMPERVPDMEAWLEEAEDLCRASTELAPGEAFPSGLQPPQIDRLAESIHHMRCARDFAASLTQVVASYCQAWVETIQSVADRNQNPIYRGLLLEQQIDLIPLGRDPESGLFEFAHLRTGAPAQRDAVTGRLQLKEEHGVVLVLLPGASFLMGAATNFSDTQGGHDAVFEADELPRHCVALAPFFISKFEMTQAQYLHIARDNPSLFAPITASEHGGHQPTLLHPVEHVSWSDAQRVLNRVDLTLPTEAQWEYAARGGTSTTWWTGDSPLTLIGAVNLSDEHRARTSPGSSATPWLSEAFDDGHPITSPVGSFCANPFGLHDVHGNVMEIVRDRYGSYELPVASGTGERNVPESYSTRVARGGDMRSLAVDVRVAKRFEIPPGGPMYTLGIRPARSLNTRSDALSHP